MRTVSEGSHARPRLSCKKRSAADKTCSSETIETELDAWQLRIAGRYGTRSPIRDAAVSPVAPRRRAEKMHLCDLANEKAFLKRNDVTILQPKPCRPFVH